MSSLISEDTIVAKSSCFNYSGVAILDSFNRMKIRVDWKKVEQSKVEYSSVEQARVV